MKSEQRYWRTEFATHPKIENFAYPHCIQRSSATRGYRVTGALRKHSSPTSVLKFSLSGKGILEVGSQRYEVPSWHAFLINVIDPEVNYYFPDDARAAWDFVYLAFNGAEKEVKSINDRFGYVYKIPENSWLVRSLLNYQEQYRSLCLLQPGAAHTLVHSYLGELADKTALVENQADSGSLFQTISAFVQDHLAERLTLTDVAGNINMSKEHLCRIFKSQTGMTVLEYIQREQLRHAKMLLQNPSFSIKEIAYQLGFANPSHFNRLFKKYTQITPLAFRKHGSPI